MEIRSVKQLGKYRCELEVVVNRIADRYEHEICLHVNGNRLRLLKSCEGDDQDGSPPSPPIQDISVEKRAQSQVALGVGMAGTSHWSISMEAGNDSGSIEFDVACTPRSQPPAYRSTYLVQPAVTEIRSDNQGLQLIVDTSALESEIDTAQVVVNGVADDRFSGRMEVVAEQGGQTIVISSDRKGDENQTSASGRWVYRFSI